MPFRRGWAQARDVLSRRRKRGQTLRLD